MVRTRIMGSKHIENYFPYAVPRPGQLSLIHSIQEEVALGNHLCVEAANGFGKTIAALSGVLPLLKKKRLGILYVARTHKQLDRVMQELRPISESKGINGVVLRGRASSCLNQIVHKYAKNAQLAMFICSQLKRSGRCEYYRNFIKKMKNDEDYLRTFYQTPLTGLELREKSKLERVCPYELSKRLLPFMTVVATTYFQIFDPYINALFFDAFGHSISHTVLLLDEAHNLPRIAVELASAKLSFYSIRQSKKEANQYALLRLSKFYQVIENILQQIIDDNAGQEIQFDPIQLTAQICEVLGIDDFENFSNTMVKTGDRILSRLIGEGKPPISYIHSVAQFFTHWCYFLQRTDAAYFVNRTVDNKSSASIEIVALDPRTSTASVLNSCHASVHLSGTLEPTSAHIDLVGLPENSRILSLPSPFTCDQILPIVSLGVTTLMRYRTPTMFKKINSRILEVCQATPHNVGIFVPSYAVIQSLLTTGLEKLLNRELFIERPKMSSAQNDSLVRKFKRKAKDGAALLGVLGGRNSEGEDYPGQEMETVVIVGVPYAKPSPKETVRIDYFEQHFPQKGRLYGYQLPAMRRASQAAGRSVRRLEDKGVIVFLDDRYATSLCRSLLPSWINENLKVSNNSDGELHTHLEKFYSLTEF
ncbi:MAG: helicase C-terminal domain-containing protein [Candidatus Thorarchaeota archaeon]